MYLRFQIFLPCVLLYTPSLTIQYPEILPIGYFYCAHIYLIPESFTIVYRNFTIILIFQFQGT